LPASTDDRIDPSVPSTYKQRIARLKMVPVLRVPKTSLRVVIGFIWGLLIHRDRCV
jgi:hypothetical protein